MRTLSSSVVYRNAWMTVREDVVQRDDGHRGVYGVVDKPDFAVILPLQDAGYWLVEQFRYPVGRRAWEFPQGSWTPGDEGSAAELAIAELREETGLGASRVRHLGHLYAAYGFCSQGFDVFVADGLTQGRTSREATEQDMRSRWVSRSRFLGMIASGEIVDAVSLAAYALLEQSRDADAGA